jgi:hypothetical protein
MNRLVLTPPATTDATPDHLLPLVERVSRLLLYLLGLLEPESLRFPERMRLARTLKRLRLACGEGANLPTRKEVAR